MTTYHVVNVLPKVEGDELEGGEHGPQEVVEARVAKVWVVPDVGQAHVAARTAPAMQRGNAWMMNRINDHADVITLIKKNPGFYNP